MFGKEKPPRPIFSRRRHGPRLPLSWILVALLVLLFWLVPVYGIPLEFISGFTPPPLRLTVPPTPTRTPKPPPEHGGRIAFTCTRGGFNQLCLINADGTGLQQLSSDLNANDYYPGFMPEGNALLFASNRNGPFDIYLMVFSQRTLLRITSGVGNVASPDFSPDGRQIVFVNRPSDGPAAIWMVNRDGSDPHLFYAGPNPIVSVDWSPDGSTIAYAMQVGAPNEYQIFLMGVDGSNLHRLTNGINGIGGSVSWNPDGTSVLIYAGPTGDRDIYRVEVQTGAATRLTRGGNNAAPAFSPDGRYIAFNSSRNNNQADLFIMNWDGSSQRQLTNDPEPDWQPCWEP